MGKEREGDDREERDKNNARDKRVNGNTGSSELEDYMRGLRDKAARDNRRLQLV